MNTRLVIACHPDDANKVEAGAIIAAVEERADIPKVQANRYIPQGTAYVMRLPEWMCDEGVQ